MTEYIIIAFLSILVVCFVFYTFWLLKRLVILSESIMDLNNEITLYSSHLEATYKKPLYYGDETLKSLLDHTRYMSDYCNDFTSAYSIIEQAPELPAEDAEEEEE
jgi:hypothetical protein